MQGQEFGLTLVKVGIAGIDAREWYLVALKEDAQVMSLRALTGKEVAD